MPSDAVPTPPRTGWLATFRNMPNDSTQKTLIVALALCLVCSILVSTAAVKLQPLQQRNQELDRKKIILEVAGLLKPGVSIDKLFKQVEPKVVDLSTGEYVDTMDPNQYDQRQAAKDPEMGVKIPPDRDIAQIRRRSKYAVVYLVKEEGQTKLILLPVHGYGLWSTMYAYIALERDANTIFGLRFYEQGETAGLGAEIDNPRWRNNWTGKVVYGEAEKPQIRVIKGTVAPGDPEAKFKIDGLAGATLTANGVTNLIHYWLGPEGFGTYLKKFRPAG
ncbi:MAG: Na(+)-translocating NADH-quinone reductase subunit C [Candidatus Binatia bacterium]